MSLSEILDTDELLRLYAGAATGAESAQILKVLIEDHALPVIKRVLRTKMLSAICEGSWYSERDFEDLCSQASLQMIERLTAENYVRNGNIEVFDIGSYAAVVAFNTWHALLAERSPHWQSLKNKIRYATGKDSEIEKSSINGTSHVRLRTNGNYPTQLDVKQIISSIEADVAGFRTLDLPHLIKEILTCAAGSLRLNELVSIAAGLRSVADQYEVPFETAFETEIALNDNLQGSMETRDELRSIWLEIADLPINQRTALLYNLRDESGTEMLFVLFNSRIAKLGDLAEALGLSPQECAHILPLLPLEDKLIAERMGITAKQVSNLRKVARENLRRRLAGKPSRKRSNSDRERA
ncbi:MAG TPA: hypothetical protein PLP07_02010 [Pyrinomonadaceae bacterium]|nr:hypothetical protein [Chloracidobacterium sp.]MBP9934749.1 hypothetical protein [Pyrinomonadaceae bacterium]MBK7803222.1 hypothetical protein [Chloracidobacterium sp.]MBK9438135.1 hypothetical protein [Chloracidobacterium sp.]MBK9767533.1 hypothetical protein [Chloracidobacterium sp.]